MLALASPGSCKGVLTPVAGAMALAAGLRAGGAEAVELPVADGGEGTVEVIAATTGGEWREVSVAGPLGSPVRARYLALPNGSVALEAAEAIGLRHVDEPDVLRASSRGLGELLLAAAQESNGQLLVCLGDTATVDGGAGLLEVVGEGFAGRRLVAACDVRNTLLGERGAARAFGPQKGASEAQVEELERRLACRKDLRPYADLPGAGAGGGLGAALAVLGAELVPGAELVLNLVGFHAEVQSADLVVTGEGTVDRSTFEGKAPGEVVQVCQAERVRCTLFGGRVLERPADVEVYELSGEPERAADDLIELGERLARSLLSVA